MTSLLDVVEIPTVPASCGRGEPPLLYDLNLASVMRAAIETLPAMLAKSPTASSIARHLHLLGPAPVLANNAWLRELEKQEGNALVLDRKGLTARGGLLPDDHLFKSMARNGLIRDNHVIWAPRYPALPAEQPRGRQAAPQQPQPHSSQASPAPDSASVPPSTSTSPASSPSASSSALLSTSPTVFNVYALSSDVCGHRGIVHGGLSSAIIDESFGYLLYLLASASAPASASASAPAQEGGVWKAISGLDIRSAMTAHLEVDFVRPLPADSSVVCITQVDCVEGRKVWMRARLTSVPSPASSGTVVYALGKALFVAPKFAGGLAA